MYSHKIRVKTRVKIKIISLLMKIKNLALLLTILIPGIMNMMLMKHS